MAKIITDSSHYSSIAKAIRDKNGKSTTYKPSEMAEAIKAIDGGGTVSELMFNVSTENIYVQKINFPPMDIVDNELNLTISAQL